VCYDDLKYDLGNQAKEILLFIKKKKIIEKEIKFLITYENELNAVVKKIDNFFVIEMTMLFLEKLCNHLSIIKNLAKLDTKRVFDIWMKFILFHEIAHVLRNHFKVNANNKFHEFKLTKNLSNRLYYELDADRFATAMLIPFLADKPKEINDMMEVSAYLFHILFIFDEESNDYSGYPHPFIRLMFFYKNIVMISKKHQQIKIDITMDNAFDRIEKIVLLNKDVYDIELLESSVEFSKRLEEYEKFIDKNKEILINDIKRKV